MLAVIIGAAMSFPAHASDGVALPAPNAVTLLALGLAGLLIGRRAASKSGYGMAR